MFTIVPNGQRVNEPSNDSANFFVDCGATEHCVDEGLIPGLRDMICEYDVLDEPTTTPTSRWSRSRTPPTSTTWRSVREMEERNSRPQSHHVNGTRPKPHQLLQLRRGGALPTGLPEIPHQMGLQEQPA